VTFEGLASYVKKHVTRDVPRRIGGGARQAPTLDAGELSGEPAVLLTIKREGAAALARGKAHLERHKYNQAIAELTEAVRLDVDEPLAYVYRSQALQRRGKAKEAVSDCNRAVQLAPNLALAYAARARAHVALSTSTNGKITGTWRNFFKEKNGEPEFACAVADCKKALELEPTLAAAYYARGVMCVFVKDDYPAAIAEITEAIQLDPKYTFAYNGRGVAYSRKGEHDKAIANFNEAIRIDARFALPCFSRGDTYANKKDPDRVVVDYTEAIRLDAKFAEAYRKRAEVYFGKKEYDKAISDYTQLIQLEPNSPGNVRRRGIAYSHKKELDKDIADLGDARRLGKGSILFLLGNSELAATYHERGDIRRDEGEYDKAIADYTEAIRPPPKRPLLPQAGPRPPHVRGLPQGRRGFHSGHPTQSEGSRPLPKPR
jgi:tetratricopeptide (TPR) repeat protein